MSPPLNKMIKTKNQSKGRREEKITAKPFAHRVFK